MDFPWYTELAAWMASRGPWALERLVWVWPFGRNVQEHTAFLRSMCSTLKHLVLTTGYWHPRKVMKGS
jgi:hypothetical protein